MRASYDYLDSPSKTQPRIPRQPNPNQIRDPETCERKLPGRHALSIGPGEIGTLERPHEIGLTALSGSGSSEILPVILPSG